MAQLQRRPGRPSIVPGIRNAIRSAALTLFRERGFEAISIGDIVLKAGVPKANVLRHFSSKDDLRREAVDTLYTEIDDFYAERWPAEVDVPLEGLAAAARVYLEAGLRWPPYIRLNNQQNPTQQDGYVAVNGTLGVSFLDRKLTVAAYVRNLFNQNFVTSIFDLPFGGAGDLGQFVTRDAQRTVGVQLGVRF